MMYQLCPRCKNLISDNATECPTCGKAFSSQPAYKRNLWWCNDCDMYVDPRYSIKRGTPVGTENILLALSSTLSGNIDDAIQHAEIASLKQKSSKNPDQYVCPKCGGTNLQKEAPKDSTEKKDDALKILKMRFVKGEITKEEYLEMKKLIT